MNLRSVLFILLSVALCCSFAVHSVHAETSNISASAAIFAVAKVEQPIGIISVPEKSATSAEAGISFLFSEESNECFTDPSLLRIIMSPNLNNIILQVTSADYRSNEFYTAHYEPTENVSACIRPSGQVAVLDLAFLIQAIPPDNSDVVITVILPGI
jgi:hypothetical protein